MSPPFAAFPEAEHRARLAALRALMQARGIGHCIAVAPESLFYYGGYDSWVSANSPQAMIFSAGDDEPTLVVRDTDIALARESSWVADVRTYRLMADDIPGLIAAVARAKGLRDGAVAVETQSYAIPHALGLALARAIAPAQIVDGTGLTGLPRLIKSPAELACLRTASRHAEAGLAAMRAALRPGITEIGLAAAIEGALRASGSDYWSIPTELSAGPRSPGGHATPRPRVIGPGELVHAEFAGVEARYHAAAVHTMSLGDPGPRAREVYAAARASLSAGIAAIRPGARVDAIEEASLDPLRAAGLDHAALMRFGYGIGISYPPIWLEPLQISRGSDQVMEEGMVFVLHAYIQLPEEGIGVIQGGTYALTAAGVEQLCGGGDVALEIA